MLVHTVFRSFIRRDHSAFQVERLRVLKAFMKAHSCKLPVDISAKTRQQALYMARDHQDDGLQAMIVSINTIKAMYRT